MTSSQKPSLQSLRQKSFAICMLTVMIKNYV